MGVHAAKRLDGFSYCGRYEYSLTICTAEQRRWFLDASAVDRARTPLLQLSRDHEFEVPAYCFMPDHVHLMVSGTSEQSDLKAFVKTWKQSAGYAHKRAVNAPLWQGGFYDRVLRPEDDRRCLIRYLLNNPIRAGLVSDLRDYAYWGSGLCSREQLIEELFDDE
jgi:putative transposase